VSEIDCVTLNNAPYYQANRLITLTLVCYPDSLLPAETASISVIEIDFVGYGIYFFYFHFLSLLVTLVQFSC